MADQNKRYIILQNEQAQDAKVIKVKTLKPNDNDGTANFYNTDQQGLTEFDSERQDYTSAAFTDSSGEKVEGPLDATIIATGVVEDKKKRIDGSSGGIIPSSRFTGGSSPAKLRGDGKIVTDGSVEGSRFVWKPNDENGYLLRETSNGFLKVPQALEREYSSNTAQKTFARPSLLALKNGNVLCAYLDNKAAPWGWTYSSNLSDTYNGSNTPTGNVLVNSPSGQYNSNIIKLHLLDQETRYWSTQKPMQNSYFDARPASATSIDYAGWLGVTGFSLVQYPDTEEVLAIYCGYVGRASTAFTQAYMCVDRINEEFEAVDSTGDRFGFGNTKVENRAKLIINNNASYSGTFDQEAPTDINGLESVYSKPLSLSAEVLPSGRLVVTIAYEQGVYSLVSDDRGRTFQATEVIDLTFGDTNFRQRVAGVDTTRLDSGAVALIVTGNGLGSRAKGINGTTQQNSSRPPQSVISVFITTDGVNWGREKILAGGAFELTQSLLTTSNRVWPSSFKSWNGESVYPLAGSIVETPDKNVMVSIVGVSCGGPGNSNRQGIYTRVLSVEELNGGQTGQDVAPSITSAVFDAFMPIGANAPRMFIMDKPLNRVMDDTYISLSDTSILKRRYCDSMTLNVGSPGLGTTGTNAMFAQPRTGSWVSPMSFGGGPLHSVGSIDIATIRYRDSVMVLDCWYHESKPLMDWPNSQNLNPVNPSTGATVSIQTPGPNSASGKGVVERAVRVQYVGGWTPAYVKRPTELRVYNRQYEVSGELTEDGAGGFNRFPSLDTSRSQTLEQFSYVLGSNAWQINLTAVLNPYYQAWLFEKGSASSSESASTRLDVTDDFQIIQIGQQITCDQGKIGYYSFREGLEGVADNNVWFPNSRGASLQNNSTSYVTDKGGFSFVSRLVIKTMTNTLVNIGTSGNPNYTVLDPDIGSKVTLVDSASTKMLTLYVGVGRHEGLIKARVFVVNGGSLTPITDHVTVADDGYSPGRLIGRCPSTEIIWGLRYVSTSSSALEPFIMIRSWDRIADPDFIASVDQADPSNSLAIFPGTWDSVTEECFEVGVVLASSIAAKKVALEVAQFSRSFLQSEGCEGYQYTDLNDTGTYDSLPSGENFWDEYSHMSPEVGLQSIRLHNGGLFAPMRPSSTTPGDQYLERGLSLSVKGLSTAGAKYLTYESDSSFAPQRVFDTPMSSGFRSSDQTVSIPVSIPGKTLSNAVVVPSQEIVIDFGENGFNPEALSVFGLNSPDFAIQLLDEVIDTNSSTGKFQWYKGPVAMCGTPDGSCSRAWQAISGQPCEDRFGVGLDPYITSPVTFKPRYEFLSGDYFLDETGIAESSPSVSDFPVRPKFSSTLGAATQNPYRIEFRGATNSGFQKHVPFRPHQFRSTDKESFYVQIVPRESMDCAQSTGDSEGVGASEVFQNFMQAMPVFNHIFKIKDNGPNWIELTTPWNTAFNQTSTTTLTPGLVNVYSDRFAFNIPDYWGIFGDAANENTPVSQGNVNTRKYRYARILLGGGTFHDEGHIRLDALIAGQRLELSTKDISVNYTYDLISGAKLNTGKSGARRSRKEHDPRRVFKLDYEPQPSAPIHKAINPKETETGTNVLGYQYSKRGYGNAFDFRTLAGEQTSVRSKLSWEEIVERIMRLGINGDVCALGLFGDEMVNVSSNLVLTPPANFTIVKALSSSHGLTPVRLTDYGGASNVAYQGVKVLKTDTGGSNPDSTQIKPRPIMEIKNIKFEEEL